MSKEKLEAPKVLYLPLGEHDVVKWTFIGYASNDRYAYYGTVGSLQTKAVYIPNIEPYELDEKLAWQKLLEYQRFVIKQIRERIKNLNNG